ncbi:MAG: tRNA (adenosine(37)-N6)-dimethylallyltransferase MiaA [Eubacteriales bacterium]|nr:tRNA (adenosine(37)-N6)-dimethylallyltransferase MiaA [Eubacteriales bacterium]
MQMASPHTQIEKKPLVIVICGPTASGKSAVAIGVAKQIHGEIISADSMQIYRSLDIGTAKVTKEEQAEIPHHLIDCCNPDETYSVAQFLRDATRKITEILQRGHVPIICGGTGLYISSLLDRVDFVETNTDISIREAFNQLAENEGLAALYTKLQQVDPDSANRIHPHDQKRIIRALELFTQTGKTQTEHIAVSRLQEPQFDFRVFVLSHDREILYQRINDRVDDMFNHGLIEEAKMFYENYPIATTAGQAIGYKETLKYLNGEATIEEAKAIIKQSTRRYAKRQLTWFRRYQTAEWLNNMTPFRAITQIVTACNYLYLL